MSLRYALIGLLAVQPASGYDLTRRFSESMAHVWPAGHGQIYPELARLTEAGFIEQTGAGPRGRRTYVATIEGVAELRQWMRSGQPDYSCRNDADLREFFLWVLPASEAISHLERDAEQYRARRAQLQSLQTTVDWDATAQSRVLRLTLEKGLQYYAMQINWATWAAAQIADGALGSTHERPVAAQGRGR